MSSSENIPNRSNARFAPISAVLIGGLVEHGQLDVTSIIDRAETMGAGTDIQALAVLNLIDRGLASVSREGRDGHLIAMPAINDLNYKDRTNSIMAYLAVTKAPAKAVGHA